MLGAEYIAQFLQKRVAKVFTFPGGTVAPIYDALSQKGVPIYVARHEQGAGYAALAAGKITQKPQVVIVTSGPGVTNLLTVIADAYYDSTPLVAITGQVGTGDLTAPRPVRQRGFQEVNTPELVKSIVKAVYQPMHPAELQDTLQKAFNTAQEGRPGPVVIDIPMDVQRSECTPDEGFAQVPVVSPPLAPDFSQAVACLSQAERPIILAGQGVLLANATSSLRSLAATKHIPVISSLLGLGAMSGASPLHLGFVGHTGIQACGTALQHADCVLVLGARLDVRQTGTLTDNFCPQASIIRIDIDAAELDFPRVPCDFCYNVDLSEALPLLVQQLPEVSAGIASKRKAWREQIQKWQETFPVDGPSWEHCELSGVSVIRELDKATKGQQVVVSTGVGAHQHWVARYFSFDWPSRILLTSGGHGAMGYDLPSIIGAALEKPEYIPLCVVGDASLQLNIQELQFAIDYALPIKVVVLDNQRMAMVSQFQKLTWGSDPTTGGLKNPDFAAIAKSYGFTGMTLTTPSELEIVVQKFLLLKGPALLHCKIAQHDDVIPMLLGGQKLDRMYPFA